MLQGKGRPFCWNMRFCTILALLPLASSPWTPQPAVHVQVRSNTSKCLPENTGPLHACVPLYTLSLLPGTPLLCLASSSVRLDSSGHAQPPTSQDIIMICCRAYSQVAQRSLEGSDQLLCHHFEAQCLMHQYVLNRCSSTAFGLWGPRH